jgi:hypothetical protein
MISKVTEEIGHMDDIQDNSKYEDEEFERIAREQQLRELQSEKNIIHTEAERGL